MVTHSQSLMASRGRMGSERERRRLRESMSLTRCQRSKQMLSWIESQSRSWRASRAEWRSTFE